MRHVDTQPTSPDFAKEETIWTSLMVCDSELVAYLKFQVTPKNLAGNQHIEIKIIIFKKIVHRWLAGDQPFWSDDQKFGNIYVI